MARRSSPHQYTVGVTTERRWILWLSKPWSLRRAPLCSGPMKVEAPSRPRRRMLFVVSRDLPERHRSLAYAFDDDDGVRVIFDRRRGDRRGRTDRKSTRLNSSHSQISYAVFCLKKKKKSHSQSVVHTTL